MHQLIEDFPSQIAEAIKIAKSYELKNDYPTFQNIVFCGLGGSGIGGRLVAQWVFDEIELPFIFCQDYDLPNFVNENTLVIASSYSGNTEETLSAVQKAKEKNASIIGICSGGQLLNFCTENNLDCITVPDGFPPRSALGYSAAQLLRILSALSLISDTPLSQLESAGEFINEKMGSIKKEAKELAGNILNKNLVIYSDAKSEAVAIRARQQFNENSKILCLHHVIPEMNHNEIVGWAGADKNRAVIFLTQNNWHPQNKKRLAFSKKRISELEASVYEIKALGENNIERSLYLISLVDWCSVYVADLKEIDPVEVNIITNLKAALR